MTPFHNRFSQMLVLAALLFPAASFLTPHATAIPAFPGAEGFGSETPGGRGGRVLFVTNLDDSGPGSLRAACEAAGPRIVLFRVSGTIRLKSPLIVREPFLTLAGQSAPGDGICLRDQPFAIATHDVVVRYLRFRLGDESGEQADSADFFTGAANSIIDHCSATWAIDECLSLSGRVANVTVQWCLIGEALHHSKHAKGNHGLGSLSRASGPVSWHHNLWLHTHSRNPRLGDNYGRPPYPFFDVRNNVVYNYITAAAGLTQGTFNANYVANYIRPGPDTRAPKPIVVGFPSNLRFHVSGNVVDGHDALTADNSQLFSAREADGKVQLQLSDTPFSAAPVHTHSALEAFALVLADAGASRPKRDPVDARLVSDVRHRTGKVIDSQTDVGGWPELKSAPPPADSDKDGMPDEWETSHGLDPKDPHDHALDRDRNGYTNIEEYLNSLASFPVAPVDGPDPREIPLPPVATTLPSLPRVTELPLRPDLPDPLVRSDGTRITSSSDWPQRRAEIRRILDFYAVGRTPPSPGNVRARELHSESLHENTVTYRLFQLTFGPDQKLSLHVGLFTPAAGGPFPVVIAPAGTPPGAPLLPRLPLGFGQGKGLNALFAIGPAPDAANAAPRRPPLTAAEIATRHADVFRRGYAYAIFNHNDCGEDTTLRLDDGSWAFRTTRFFPAYPNYDWGLLGSWAWGVSRIIDHLVTEPSIDPKKIIVTGVSRTGKSALIAGAFDERIALTAPVVTGGGGVGAYRFSGAGRGGKEGLGEMMRKYPNWFSPHLRQFWGHTDRLPFDQHGFLALIAPRAFLALEGKTDSVSLPHAVRQTFLAAQPVYNLFNARARLGVHYADHGHTFTEEDWSALLDFADARLRGKNTTRRFDEFPPDR